VKDELPYLSLLKLHTILIRVRMGLSGWVNVPGLDMDANVGLHDCMAAAEWTSKYIDKFGGDPQRTTVMGQSSGAGIIGLSTILNGGQGKLPFQQVGKNYGWRLWKTPANHRIGLHIIPCNPTSKKYC
jgi:hypothetical protein